MSVILFQGDSITDCTRIREDEFDLGKGYASYVSARLGCESPEKYKFYNRGISGNRIVDVYARIKADSINLKPDFMSLLIGVNDFWHDFARNDGVDHKKFEKVYSMFIEEFQEVCPNTKIMIMEPFILEDVFVARFGGDTQEIRNEVRLRAEVAKRIAEKYDLSFMSLQEDLDNLATNTKYDYWLRDGVHPTIYFHNYIAEKWIKIFKSMGE